MAFDIDAVLDRRRLRRKLSFWRIGAIVTLAIAVIAILAAAGVFTSAGTTASHIARVEISGVITEDRPLLQLLEKLRTTDNVKAVLLSVDSPGGTTVGGEAIFEAVRKLAKDKPVASSVGTLAASAGYMIATASDHIVARRSSIVGSIGVIFQYPQISELLDKIGVKVKEVKSSPLKAEPSPFNPTPPAAEEAMKVLIMDSYAWFVDLVTDRRPMSRSEVLQVADGRVFSGDRSLELKLIDAVGGEDKAKEWLAAQQGVGDDLKLVDWKPTRPSNNLFLPGSSAAWLAEALGLPVEGLDALRKRMFVDGLLSIWQAE